MNRNILRSLIFAAVLAGSAAPSFAGAVVAVTVAPPPLRVYVQPACPGDGYIWTPGYWAYGPTGYYWVPGAWVLAPHPGYLFTPGYWGFVNGAYLWHRGYWGLRVGYYGGVNYGFGYMGVGFHGGYWEGGHFFYNREFANVDERRIHHFYRGERHDRDRGRFHGHEERHARHEAHSHQHERHAEHAHAHATKAASHSGGHSGSGHASHHGRR